jgi:hypothetical protein
MMVIRRPKVAPVKPAVGSFVLGKLKMELVIETEVVCPHCGESFPLQVDTSQSEQSLIEDCTVCCRPIALTIHCRPGEIESVSEAAG